LTFSNIEEAAAALDHVESNYSIHQRRAREMAETYLDSRLVLGDILSVIGV